MTPKELTAIQALHERANLSCEIRHNGYTRVDVDEDDQAFYRAMYEAWPLLLLQIQRLDKQYASLLRVVEAAREFRIAYAVHRDAGGAVKPVVETEIKLIQALAALPAPGERKKFTITDIAPDEFKKLNDESGTGQPMAPGERKDE